MRLRDQCELWLRCGNAWVASPCVRADVFKNTPLVRVLLLASVRNGTPTEKSCGNAHPKPEFARGRPKSAGNQQIVDPTLEGPAELGAGAANGRVRSARGTKNVEDATRTGDSKEFKGFKAAKDARKTEGTKADKGVKSAKSARSTRSARNTLNAEREAENAKSTR